MPTSVNVNEPSPRDRTRAYVKDGTRVAIALLIPVGLVWLVVGKIYLHSLVDPVHPQAGQFFVGP